MPAVCEGELAELDVAPMPDWPIPVTNANAAVTGADDIVNDHLEAPSDDIGDHGWATREKGWGVEHLPRAQAIARIEAAPLRVFLEPTFTFEECRNGLATHAYFQVPAAGTSGATPFQAAVMVDEVLPWGRFERRRELYVAGVRVGKPWVPEIPSCMGPMPPRDAEVLALVRVKSVAEGLRLLEAMR